MKHRGRWVLFVEAGAMPAPEAAVPASNAGAVSLAEGAGGRP